MRTVQSLRCTQAARKAGRTLACHALDAGDDLRDLGSRAGISIVELLVVMLILTLLAAGMGTAISAALTLEQNFREESDVRTSLARDLAYAERYLSLAKSWTNGVALYRLETAGVSFETNHRFRVTSNALSVTNGAVLFHIVSGDGKPPDQRLSADGALRAAPARVTNALLEGTGAVRRLTLSAEYAYRTREGVWTNLPLTASRPIRFWSQPP